jgi:hypothetical protein
MTFSLDPPCAWGSSDIRLVDRSLKRSSLRLVVKVIRRGAATGKRRFSSTR